MTMVLAPKQTINILPSTERVQNASQRVLMLGVIGSETPFSSGAPSTPTLTLIENIQTGIYDPAIDDWPPDAAEYVFGVDSEITKMINKFREINKVTPVDAIALPIDAGSASNSNFQVVGPATSDGVLVIQISSPEYEYSIPISNTDTATVIATAIRAAINADDNALVTATGATDVVTITPKYLGHHSASASQFRMISCTATGITFDNVYKAFPNPFISDYPGLYAAIDGAGKRYQTIICPNVYTLQFNSDNPLGSGIADIYLGSDNWWDGRENEVKDTVVLTGYAYDRSNTNDPGFLFAPVFNTPEISFFTDIGPNWTNVSANDGLVAPFDVTFSIFEYTPVILAKFAAIRSLRLSDGEALGDYVISRNGPLDAFGGTALASKPYFNTPVPGLTIVDKVGPLGSYGFTETEISTLVKDRNMWTIGYNSAKTETILSQVTSCYNSVGIPLGFRGDPDPSFFYLNYVDTISNVREYFFNNLKTRFAQSRLTTGDVLRGRDMANEETIAAYCELLYQDLSGRDFVLVQAGEDAVAYFKKNLVISINLSLGRATLDMKVPIVTQLREILATIQLSFGTEG